jgi:hypothetical protein
LQMTCNMSAADRFGSEEKQKVRRLIIVHPRVRVTSPPLRQWQGSQKGGGRTKRIW